MAITGRTMLSGLATGAVSSTVLGAANAEPIVRPSRPVLKQYDNDLFYKEDGSFDVPWAKRVYHEMMKFFRYPIPERLRGEDLWTLDFGLGAFTEVGMAGVFWINNKRDDYFGHEIYLLPGQMIPEHKHVETADARPKMEGWHVRHGWVYIYGEGEPTPGVDARVPPSHRECAVARTEQKLMPGEVGTLRGPTEWHWMLAGDKGAIVSEYASYHDGTGLRFSHPKVTM